MGERTCRLRIAREGLFLLKTFNVKRNGYGPEENCGCVTLIPCNNQPKPLCPGRKSVCKLMVFFLEH